MKTHRIRAKCGGRTFIVSFPVKRNGCKKRSQGRPRVRHNGRNPLRR